MDMLDSIATTLGHIDFVALIQTKLARAVGMFLLVVGIISLIGLLYGSNNQKIGKVHFAFRPHQASRRTFEGIIAQKNDDYLPVQSDGMAATVNFYFGWHDRKGRFRKYKLATKALRLSVQANAVPPIQNFIHGAESVEGVRTEDVFIPALDDKDTEESVRVTPEQLTEYYTTNNVLARWPHEDNAKLISLPEELVADLKADRAAFIQECAGSLRIARSGSWWQRRKVRRLSDNRVSPLGGYYIDLRFHWDPYFVLFRHPDRELKMTAWLTVLTSAFSLVMDLWPVRDAPDKPPTSIEKQEKTRPPTPRPPVRIQT